MTKHLLSKSTFIRGQQCQKSLYLHAKRPFLRDKLGPEQLAKFRRGTDIGVLARDLFPGGTDMSPKSPSQYQKMRDATAEAVLNKETNILYEAVFQHDDVLIMLDILVRNGSKWNAYEVKSSRSISETYLKDAALQHYVLRGCNIELSSFHLIYINENYVLEGSLDLHKLFIMKDVTKENESMLPEIQLQIARSKQSLQQSSSPSIQIGLQCFKPYPCDFKGHCWKNIVETNILNMQSIPLETRFELFHQGIQSVDQLPDSYQNQSEIKSEIEAFTSKSLKFDEQKLLDIRKKFLPFKTQTAYFKLITTESVLPIIENTQPYSPLPLALAFFTPGSGAIQIHYFNQKNDSIDRFLKAFEAVLSSSSFIITDEYNTIFETLDKLKTAFPYITEKENEIRNKIIGLDHLAKECMLYHPAFHQKFDLAVLQTVVSRKSVKLTHTLYIIKDIYAAELPDQEKIIHRKVSQYIESIQDTFCFFVEA